MSESYRTWAIILPVLERIDALVSKAKRGLAAGQARTIDPLREDVRRSLLDLKDRLRASGLSDATVAYLIFALVCFVDERILRQSGEPPTGWRQLQVELLGTDDGGEYFFRELQQAVDDVRAPSVVFEVFHYCIQEGFRGKYEGDVSGLVLWQEKLRLHIDDPPEALVARQGEATPDYDWSDRVSWQTWGGAVLIVAAIHLFIAVAWRL